MRWLSQGMHRAAVPPRPHRPAARADNDAAAAVPLNEDAVPGNIYFAISLSLSHGTIN